MDKKYFKNYLKAIDKPLPELKETFKQELKFLKKRINKNLIVLDVGCGAGRPAKDLSKDSKKIFAIDNDLKMLKEAVKRCKKIKNIYFKKSNALKTNFQNNIFDLTYSTYNLVGSLPKSKRQKFIKEMVRVTKKGGLIVNFTWTNNKITKDFLKKYYPYIGIKIIRIDNKTTLTDRGTFAKISRKELSSYYKSAGLREIKFFKIGKTWTAIKGTK